MNVQDIVPTIDADFGRGESTRSYLYSPHLLYSPHILYPGGVMYGIYPTSTNETPNLTSHIALETLMNGLSDILPMGDNKDIRP